MRVVSSRLLWTLLLCLLASLFSVSVTLAQSSEAEGIETSPRALDFGVVRVGDQETLPVTVRNTTEEDFGEPFSVTVEVFLVGQSSVRQAQVTDFSLDVSAPVLLEPGETLTVNVTFAPLVEGLQEDMLYVCIFECEALEDVPLAGFGGLPEIDVSAPSIDFEKTLVGQRLRERLTIFNLGEVSLELSGVEITGMGAEAFSASISPATIPPDASLLLEVFFDPEDAGIYQADLNIFSDDPQNPEVVIPLSGVGARLDFTPSALFFGPVPVGEQATAQLEVANTGPVVLNVGDFVLAGPDADRFGVALASKAQAFELGPGESQFVEVTFSPNRAGSHTARLLVPTDAGELAVSLAGDGATAVLSLSASELDFGDVPLGTEATLSVLITNDGPAPLSLTSIAVVEGGEAFQITEGGEPTVVAPDGDHTVAVTFRPVAGGVATATLRLQSNDPDLPQADVALTGRGIQALSVMPTALDFGTVRVGQAGTLDLVLTNSSNLALTIDEIAVDGDETFGVDDAGPFPVPPLSGVTRAVSFQPAARGAREAVLRIESDDPGQPAITVALSGQGVAPVAAVAPAALDFGMITLGRAVEQAFALENTGDASLTVSGILIAGPGSEAFALIDAPFVFVLEPGEQQAFTVRFQPTTAASFGATVLLDTDDPGAPQLEVGLTGEAAVIQNLSPTTAEEGTAVPIAFDVPADLRGGSGQVFYRVGGGGYQSMPMTVQGTAWQATIPAASATPRGLQYYATFVLDGEAFSIPAQDPANAPLQIRVRTDARAAPGALVPEGYRMVSVPVALDASAAASVFEDDFGPWDPNQWRLLFWNASRAQYDEHPTVEAALAPGRAFWLITRSATGFDVEGGLSTDLSAPFALSLRPGWSQIADPFAFPVAWSRVLGREQVQGPFAHDGQQYVPNQQALVPWQGYFVFNPSAGPVQLRVPPVEGTLAGKGASPAFAEEAYVLQLRAEAPEQGLQDVHNYLGFAEDAQARSLALNLREPPRVGRYVQLSIVEQASPMMSRFLPPGGSGGQWDLELSAALEDRRGGPLEVRITLVERGRRPEGFTVRVIDRDEGRELPADAFTVALPSPEAVRHLRVIVGTDAFAEDALVPRDFALEPNYPNPFNPETVIRYGLSRQSRVALVVYDALGRRVRTLVETEQEAGRYEVRWDGRDDAGRPAASGVYVYHLRAEAFTASRTMLLLR